MKILHSDMKFPIVKISNKKKEVFLLVPYIPNL